MEPSTSRPASRRSSASRPRSRTSSKAGTRRSSARASISGAGRLADRKEELRHDARLQQNPSFEQVRAGHETGVDEPPEVALLRVAEYRLDGAPERRIGTRHGARDLPHDA